MDRLEGSDQARLLAFAAGSDAPSALGRAAAREYVLAGLSGLIGGDCVFLRVCAAHENDEATATVAEIQASQHAQAELWGLLVGRGSHPMVNHWLRTEDHRAIRMSDIVNRGALHGSEIWNQFWRPFGIEQTLGTRIRTTTQSHVDLGFYRTGSDYKTRDVAVLDQARALVGPILQRGEVAALVAASVKNLGITAREAEILAWVSLGRTNGEIASGLFLSRGTVKKHLDRIYQKLSIRTRTQAAGLALAAGRSRSAEVPAPLLGEVVRVALGLTPREADVLALVATGRTNAEVATTLGSAPGTVKRHLENLYRKLEVGTRTEAASMALEAIGAH